MRNAELLIFLAAAGAGLASCSENASPDQNVLIDTNVPADAEIEALPPDDSSGPATDGSINGNDSADGDYLGNATESNY